MRLILGPIAFVLIPGSVFADSCSEMEEAGKLLHQQFKSTKVCTESDISTGWTDCTFRAGDTKVLLAGALGMDVESRIQGISGSGFHILSVDDHTVLRVFLQRKFGLLVRADAANLTEPTGCLYNTAYITLDAQVLSPGEMNTIVYDLDGAQEDTKDPDLELEEGLVALGFDPGPVDGVIDGNTQRSLDQYRRKKGLGAGLTLQQIRGLVSMDLAIKQLEELEKAFKDRAKPKPPFAPR